MERVRKNFATAETILEPPHLISMQRLSYEKFLQMDRDPDDREDFGLQAILKNVFPISDLSHSSARIRLISWRILHNFIIFGAVFWAKHAFI